MDLLIALALVATQPVVTPPEPLPAPPRTEVLATATDPHDRMMVDVSIGERGPFRFMIDTGSQNTVLSTTLAARLGLATAVRRSVLGVAGRRDVDTVELTDIRLGRRSFDGFITPLLERADLGADGIIGIDGLQGQRVMLDFARQRITVADARSQGGDRGFEIVVTARRHSGQLILTHAEIDGVYTDVVIDTGAEDSIGNRALQRALSRHHDGATATLTSVTGQTIMADIGVAHQLTVDRLHINNILVAYADSPTFAALNLEKRPAIMLGMRELRLFKRVAIDFNTRKVLFDISEHSAGPHQLVRR